MHTPKFVKRFCAGIGFHALTSSKRDVKLLILLRMIRLFGCGGATLILALYLSALGFSDSKIGLFMTLTLVGNLLVSVIMTYIGDAMGVRVTIAIGALFMAVSGFAFANLDNYWLLLLASVAGVINPSANEVDPFKAVEESAIARLSQPEDCSDIFAWWSMLGMFGTAGSTVLTGSAIEILQDHGGLSTLDSYRIIFFAYSALAHRNTSIPGIARDSAVARGRARKSIQCYDPVPIQQRFNSTAEANRDLHTRILLFRLELCLAMGLDFIGSGLAQISWMSYFFKREYHVAEGQLGLAIFIASLTSSVLNLASSPLARAIGQVPTMVVCHTINSVSRLMISVPNKTLALLLLIFRIVTRELDNAPRQAFISAGVLDEERASAMGMVNITKTIGSCIGLFLTGQLADMGKFSVAFILAGCLKLGYNVLISAFFWRTKRGKGVHVEGT
ncbi:putative membrane protein [Lachnellula suecica]|uniref:Putative membrane protein n=1 Tax=Lachnellula suecica TaxID=602035 RepID=A0A8T9BS36_9HELO|nr:putative membrane protein [Lachnellula suecica]